MSLRADSDQPDGPQTRGNGLPYRETGEGDRNVKKYSYQLWNNNKLLGFPTCDPREDLDEVIDDALVKAKSEHRQRCNWIEVFEVGNPENAIFFDWNEELGEYISDQQIREGE